MLVMLSLVAGLPVGPALGSDVIELEWGPDIRLSESTETSDDPTIALMPDGGMVTAWRERLAARYLMRGHVRSAGRLGADRWAEAISEMAGRRLTSEAFRLYYEGAHGDTAEPVSRLERAAPAAVEPSAGG